MIIIWIDIQKPIYFQIVSHYVTNDNFANFQHCDKDHSAIAFGLWWTSARALTPDGQLVYSFPSGLYHDQIDSGGFLWGKYGIGVDFQW